MGPSPYPRGRQLRGSVNSPQVTGQLRRAGAGAAPSLPVRRLHDSYGHTQADVQNQHSSPESGRRNHPDRFGNLDPKPLRWEIHLEDVKTTGILREAAKIPASKSFFSPNNLTRLHLLLVLCQNRMNASRVCANQAYH